MLIIILIIVIFSINLYFFTQIFTKLYNTTLDNINNIKKPTPVITDDCCFNKITNEDVNKIINQKEKFLSQNNNIHEYKKDELNNYNYNYNYISSDNELTFNNKIIFNDLIYGNNKDNNLNFNSDVLLRFKNDLSTRGFNNSNDLQRLLDDAFPQGMIVPWYQHHPSVPMPRGWALCDGDTYKMNSSGEVIRTNDDDPEGIKTPNLIYKFVLSRNPNGYRSDNLGFSDILVKSNDLHQTGGTSTVELEGKHLPYHNHKLFFSSTVKHERFDASRSSSVDNYEADGSELNLKNLLSYTGDIISDKDSEQSHGNAHNNMPPFIGLKFIKNIDINFTINYLDS